jgi:hypothetical protein
MLTPPFLYPPDDPCPPPPASAPAPRPDVPGDFALGPDGAAHLLVRDAWAVCWWVVGEDGESALIAIWPTSGPVPEAIHVAEDGAAVLVGAAGAGFAVTRVGTDGLASEVALPVRGTAGRLETDGTGRVVRLVLREEQGGASCWRVDLRRGRADRLATLPGAAVSARRGGPDAP